MAKYRCQYFWLTVSCKVWFGKYFIAKFMFMFTLCKQRRGYNHTGVEVYSLLYTLYHIHGKENPIYVFLFWESRGLSSNFHIHESVSYFYIPRIGPHVSLQQNRQTDPGNI
jgi:hypothetical protein